MTIRLNIRTLIIFLAACAATANLLAAISGAVL